MLDLTAHPLVQVTFTHSSECTLRALLIPANNIRDAVELKAKRGDGLIPLNERRTLTLKAKNSVDFVNRSLDRSVHDHLGGNSLGLVGLHTQELTQFSEVNGGVDLAHSDHIVFKDSPLDDGEAITHDGLGMNGEALLEFEERLILAKDLIHVHLGQYLRMRLKLGQRIELR